LLELELRPHQRAAARAGLSAVLLQIGLVLEGVLFVRTTADAMIVALDRKGEKLWNYHGEQIPRWSAEHRKQLQR
jgi:hypothetical protein